MRRRSEFPDRRRCTLERQMDALIIAAGYGSRLRELSDSKPLTPIAGVALIEAFRDASPSRFAWRDPPYEYEADKPPIDILYGSAALREDFAAGRRAADLAATWPEAVAPFLDLRRQFLLY
jgi:hypothetical protein